MNAPEAEGASWVERMHDALAAAAKVADPDERETQAEGALRRLLGERGDELAVQQARTAVKRLGPRVMPLSYFDALVRELPRPGSLALLPEAPELGDGIEHIPGVTDHVYRPALNGDAGEVFKLGRHGICASVLPWAPRVPRVFDHAEGRRFFEVEAGGRSVTAPLAELLGAELWERLPSPGTGPRRIREVLAAIVQAEAEREGCELIPALASTGWHQSAEGEWFYAFADGRTYPERSAYLVGAPAKLREAAAPAAMVPGAAIVAALVLVAEHGRGPCLLGVGIGVRSLGQSRHKVLGGYIIKGPPNSGKSSVAWHARTQLTARPGRANAFPPLPSATFADTVTAIEFAVHFQRDMPALLDDAALHAKSTRAELAAVTNVIDRIFRPLANDAPIRERSDRETQSTRPPRYVNSPVIATVQDFQAQDSLKRRVFVVEVRPGDINIRWYRGPDSKPGTNSAALVGPLRSLAEHYVIPYLAHMGDQASEYLMWKDAEALRMLAPALDAERPGWRDSGEGLAGVVDIAAAAIAGLLIAADVLALSSAQARQLAAPAVEAAARYLAAQAAELAEGASVASPAEALGELLRDALLGGRAHMRRGEGDGEPFPVVPGLAEQEQGLELIVRSSPAEYRGRGAALYWLPEVGAVGVKAESLHALMMRAADPRLPIAPPKGLARALGRVGAVMRSPQGSNPYSYQKWVGGASLRLVLVPAEFISPEPNEGYGSEKPLEPLEPLDPMSDADNRTQVNAPAAVEAAEAFAALVETDASQVTDDEGGVLVSASGQPLSVVAVLDSAEPLAAAPGAASGAPELLAEAPPIGPGEGGECAHCGAWCRRYGPNGRPLCPSCSGIPDGPLPADDGGPFADLPSPESYVPHVPESWGPDAEAAYEAAAQRAAPVGGGSPSARRPAQRAEAAVRSDRPAHAFLVLGGDGRAYGPEGVIVEAPAELLGNLADVGALADAGMRLGTGRLWVPSAAREALGLPAELPDVASAREGVPHRFAEAADTARWDIWPDEPIGLGAWMNVYRAPRAGEGIAIAFPEWMPPPGGTGGPQFGALAPAELAHALTLIWQSSVYEGKGGKYGGAHYRRSPGTWFKQLVDMADRRGRKETPEPAELPPPFDRDKPIRAGVPRLVIPGAPYMGPPAEVPAGWLLARLDVRSCFAAAARSTPIGYGNARRARPGELTKAPGVHLVRAPADQAAIDPSLFGWFPAPARGQTQVSAWLDTSAALWLAESGVPVTVDESYTWAEARRPFDSVLSRLLAARERLSSSTGAAEQLAEAVVKAAANRYLGGWLGSDFGGDRSGDWHANRHAWLAIRAQAEARKQRNLVPMIAAGVVVLGGDQIDSIYAAAPSAEAIASAPGTGGRAAVGDGGGKFKVEAVAEVTPELAELLADGRASADSRRMAVRAALGAAEAAGEVNGDE